MPVELLIARPASGKTQTCIQRVRAMPPLAETWVLLPDRLQAAAFRRRLAQAGGAIGAHVGTFGDLYRAILERADRDVPVASAPLLHYVLQDVVDALAAKDKLAHYAPLRGLPGFYLALRDSFAELKRALVYPDQFTKFTETGSPARQELALLYAAYQARLQELGWADADGLSWLAVETLENRPKIAQSIQLLVVDGFDSFNGAQRQALKLLSEQVQHLLITFPGEPGSNRPAHRRFAGLLEKLTGELKPEIADLPGQPFLPPDALHLEANLFESDELQAQTPGQPFLLETRSPADEAREALRWIKVQVVREGLPLSECAVFTPNPDIYNPFLRSVAAEFGIPVHFTQSIPLKDSPAIAALLNLLGLPAENFRSRLLFNTLRSPYFELGVDTGTVDALEEISRVARIAEGRQAWQATWERLIPSEYTDQADLDGLLPENHQPKVDGCQHDQQGNRQGDGCFNGLNRLAVS